MDGRNRKPTYTIMDENKVIYLDLDGVCIEDRFPFFGNDIPDAVRTIEDLVEAGYSIVLWTCRESHSHMPDVTSGTDFLAQAVQWFIDRSIPLAAINTTPTEIERRTLGWARKPLGGIFIDDRNIGGFIGWDKVREELL